MIFKPFESWFRSKSLFNKGVTISGIVIILVVYLDLIKNGSLITQYIYILTYIAIILTSLKATDYFLYLSYSYKEDCEQSSEGKQGTLRLVLRNLIEYMRSRNNTFKSFYESYSYLKTQAQKRNYTKSFEIETNPVWCQDEIEEFVLAISKSCIRSWTEAITSIHRTESYQRDATCSPIQSKIHGKLQQDDLAGDIEEELRCLLSSILSKIRSLDKTTLTNDILSIARCHLKRLRKVIVYQTGVSGDAINEKEMRNSFQFRHHTKTNKSGVNEKCSQTPHACRTEMLSNISRTNHFENSAKKLLSFFCATKSPATLKNVLINRLLIQLIAHQIFLDLGDVISDPNNIRNYFCNLFSREEICQDRKTKEVLGHETHSQTQTDRVSQATNLDKDTAFRAHCNTITSSEEKNGEIGKSISNGDTNMPCPETIDLTGYKFENDYPAQSVTSSSIERTNVNRGSGRVSQALGGLFSYAAGPLLPGNIAFKPFNKMWKAPLHQNRILNRMKGDDSIAKKANLAEGTSKEYSVDGIVTDQDGIINTSIESLNLDVFRRHRPSLPNNIKILKNFENYSKHVNNLLVEIPDRVELSQQSVTTTRLPFKFPWSKAITSRSMPASPVKSFMNQPSLNNDITQINSRPDYPESNSTRILMNNRYINDISKQKLISIDIPISSIDEGTGLIFEIGERVQHHKNNNAVTSSNTSNNSDDELHPSCFNSTNDSEVDMDSLSSSLEFEDNNDLESTISKLRHLLSQTKSDENSSADSGVHPTDLFERDGLKSPINLKNVMPDTKNNEDHPYLIDSKNIEIDTADATLDGRLFYNIHITDVDVVDLPRKSKPAKNSPRIPQTQEYHSLVDASSLIFSISYEGIYIEEMSPNINNQKDAESAKSQVNPRPRNNSFRYTLEHESVKRKYQEFVLLQKHIENKISVNSNIWSLRENSPKEKSSWLNNIHNKFGNQKSNFTLNEMVDIQERREYLEKWLIDICGNSTLCHTPELKEFLSYPIDNVFVVARKSSRNVKSDKRFFARKVSGVINSIKDVFPNFDDDHPELFSSINSNKAESKLNDDESISTSTPRTTKSFLLPDFFSSSNIQTPSLSPSVEKASSHIKESANVKGPPQALGFKFSSDYIERSEFQTTVDFRIQYHEERVINKKVRNKKNAPRNEIQDNKCSNYYRSLPGMEYKGEDKSTSSHLADGLLESILIEIIPILLRKDSQPMDWLSKDITVQLVKVLLGDALSNMWEGLLQSVDCDDKWKYYLSSLRHHLWPESPCDNTPRKPHIKQTGHLNSSIDELHQTKWQHTLIQDALKAFKFDLNDLQKILIDATSNKEINEDFVYVLFDTILARLLD